MNPTLAEGGEVSAVGTSAADQQRPSTASAAGERGPLGTRSVRFGRLFGIEVRIDWSWVFIFLLITLSLGQLFSQGEQALGQPQAWTAGLLASLLFFGSILLHEFGHSLTAQALGIRVRSITLFLFGGLARLEAEPESPRDEFLIAAAGPLVSVVLGGVFLFAAAIFSANPEVPSVFGVAFGWLGTINLVLAAFNLVPGFPLDGGRLMRAAVWKVTGDYDRATLVAASIGSGFAYFLIAGGIFIALVLGAFLNGLWFVFIGWFLLSAARGSSLQVILRRELSHIPIIAAMERLHPIVSGETTVNGVLENLILAQGGRYFFVEERGEVTGLVTLHQIKETPRGDRSLVPVRSIMITLPDLVTVPADRSLWQAFQKMNEAAIGQVPVEQAGRLVGMLTRERMIRIIQNVTELGPRGPA